MSRCIALTWYDILGIAPLARAPAHASGHVKPSRTPVTRVEWAGGQTDCPGSTFAANFLPYRVCADDSLEHGRSDGSSLRATAMETHWLQVRIVGGTAMMRIARLARRGLDMRFLALWIGIEVGSAAWAAGPVPSTTGCPMFHCTVEATGVISEALLSHPTTVLSSSALGTIEHQGCSGDGPRIACLFTADAVTSGIGRGTLKVLDATTLQPIWGSGGVPDSYDIDPSSFSTGQVPLLFANGSLAATHT